MVIHCTLPDGINFALINHSSNPSCYWHTAYPDLKENQDAAVIALRDIHPDDEITVDFILGAYDVPGRKNYCRSF